MLIELMKDKVKCLKSDKYKERGSSGKDIESATASKSDCSGHP